MVACFQALEKYCDSMAVLKCMSAGLWPLLEDDIKLNFGFRQDMVPCAVWFSV